MNKQKTDARQETHEKWKLKKRPSQNPFKGGSTVVIPNLNPFFLAFSNLEDEIPFKGGSL
jgi:hypothetical protein